jgi:hypothetical protein
VRLQRIILYDAFPGYVNLKDKCSTLGLLLSTQFKVLASLQWQLGSVFAFIAFQAQHDLLCCFRLEIRTKGIQSGHTFLWNTGFV